MWDSRESTRNSLDLDDEQNSMKFHDVVLKSQIANENESLIRFENSELNRNRI